MNLVKKLLAAVIALVMMLGLGVTAMADGDEPGTDPAAATPDYSITVNNAKPGETYTAYKMFDLSVDDPTDPTAYRYTVNSAWTAFAETEEFLAVYIVDDQGYVTSSVSGEPTWSATSRLSILAEKAAAYAKTNNINPAGSVIVAEGGDSGKINLTEAGYYVIASTLGTRAMIETTPSNSEVTVNEKNELNSIDKTVKEDSTGNYGINNDSQIGDVVEFKSIVTVVPRSVNVKIHDTMTDGLTFNTGSIKIYTDEALTNELSSARYEIPEPAETGDTFTIRISDSFAATANEDQHLYIVYSATLNENALDVESGVAIVDQTNTTHVSFGDGTSSEDDTTTTTTHKFEILKHNSKDEILAGAHFKLYVMTSPAVEADEDEGIEKQDAVYTEVQVVKIDDNNYRVAESDETGVEIVTVESGNIVIWGVDSDTYYLEETAAPDGYNQLPDKREVVVNSANNTVADILNQTGTELPSTGGMGTTLFYVLGTILVAAAGILLVSRRRMSE